MPEISDEEWQVLQGSKKLMDQLLKHPKTKRDVERAVKTLHPDTVTSEDFEKPIVDKIDGLEKKLDEYFKAEQEKRIDEQLSNGFSELRKSGLTDDGIEKVKKIMLEKHIADPIVAGAYFEKINPPPPPQAPSSLTPAGWGFGAPTKDESLKELFADEDAWADKMAVTAWNETKQGIITE